MTPQCHRVPPAHPSFCSQQSGTWQHKGALCWQGWHQAHCRGSAAPGQQPEHGAQGSAEVTLFLLLIPFFGACNKWFPRGQSDTEWCLLKQENGIFLVLQPHEVLWKSVCTLFLGAPYLPQHGVHIPIGAPAPGWGSTAPIAGLHPALLFSSQSIWPLGASHKSCCLLPPLARSSAGRCWPIPACVNSEANEDK